MSYRVLRFESTPNPNAVKCILDRSICDAPRSFRSPEAGQTDPIAHPLFQIPGVALLLLGGTWITVNKSPDAAWPPIKKAVKQTLKDLPHNDGNDAK